jgi:hypothetical protein
MRYIPERISEYDSFRTLAAGESVTYATIAGLYRCIFAVALLIVCIAVSFSLLVNQYFIIY